MDTFITTIVAIDNRTGELNNFCGENVSGYSMDDAQSWCNIHKPYLRVIGRLCVTGTFENDGTLNIGTDYDQIKNN